MSNPHLSKVCSLCVYTLSELDRGLQTTLFPAVGNALHLLQFALSDEIARSTVPKQHSDSARATGGVYLSRRTIVRPAIQERNANSKFAWAWLLSAS